MSVFQLCNYNHSEFTSSGVPNIKLSLQSLTQFLALSFLALIGRKGEDNFRSMLGSFPYTLGSWGCAEFLGTNLGLRSPKMSLICSYGLIRSRWHPGSCVEHRYFLVRLLRVPFFEMCSLLLFPSGVFLCGIQPPSWWPSWDVFLSHPSLLYTILHSSCHSFTSRKMSI